MREYCRGSVLIGAATPFRGLKVYQKIFLPKNLENSIVWLYLAANLNGKTEADEE